eukprot:scaffold1992_cov187-Amphora_coffeaeformis.AAC.27
MQNTVHVLTEKIYPHGGNPARAGLSRFTRCIHSFSRKLSSNALYVRKKSHSLLFGTDPGSLFETTAAYCFVVRFCRERILSLELAVGSSRAKKSIRQASVGMHCHKREKEFLPGKDLAPNQREPRFHSVVHAGTGIPKITGAPGKFLLRIGNHLCGSERTRKDPETDARSGRTIPTMVWYGMVWYNTGTLRGPHEDRQ